MNLVDRGAAPTTSVGDKNEVGGVVINNSSYIGVPKTELKNRDPDYEYERDRAINWKTPDGVKPMTKEEQDFERSVSWTMIKKLTMKIFSMDFTSISFPVAYSEQRSFLERTADLFAFLADGALDKAADIKEPGKRLLEVTTGIIGGFHLYMQSKKPWNPVLGETYIGRWPNGATIYGEQISHHPPVSAFQIFDANGKWKCHAKCEFTVSTGMFQVDVHQNGVFCLEFQDGTKLEWEFPDIIVGGIIRGDRIVKVRGPLDVVDLTNDLECHIDIGVKPSKSNGIKKKCQTSVYGGVRGIDDEDFMDVISGDYTEKLENKGVVWDINTSRGVRATGKIGSDEILLSDCRFRADRYFLINGQMEDADMAKCLIEDCQRRDKTLRR